MDAKKQMEIINLASKFAVALASNSNEEIYSWDAEQLNAYAFRLAKNFVEQAEKFIDDNNNNKEI